MKTGGYYDPWEFRRNACICLTLFFSHCIFTGGELNCDLTNRLRNTCKLCLWLINLQMFYAVEIIRGNLSVSLSTTCVHSHLLGMNWTLKALLLTCKQYRDYSPSPDRHTLFRIRVQILKTEGFPGGTVVKNMPANTGDSRDVGLIRGLEDPLQEETATHSSILAWRIPWTEEPGWLQSMGSQRVGHDWTHTYSCLKMKALGSGWVLESLTWGLDASPSRPHNPETQGSSTQVFPFSELSFTQIFNLTLMLWGLEKQRAQMLPTLNNRLHTEKNQFWRS